jgi:aspartyl-tRNA(Asn)/glutamyl-tRNA(Gln) amidotransferase subunit A
MSPSTPLPTLVEALSLFRSGALRPSELLEQVLARIEELDPELGAYVSVDPRGARDAARAADRAWAEGRAGPLCGVPLSVKDIFDVRDTVTGCGNLARTRSGARAGQDAAVVRQVREAGAVLVGKTHLHEHALGITGENPRLGTPKNPHDPSRLPGGSSSGSAVSVAAGMAVASIGTDTGGSVRVPAALCGVVGFKPSFGRIGTEGLHPLSRSMDHVGFLGACVEDSRALFDVLKLKRRRSSTSVETRTECRLALVKELWEMASGEVRQVLAEGLDRLTCTRIGTGITIHEVSLPQLREEARTTYTTLLLHEAVRVHERVLKEDPDQLGPGVRELLTRGRGISTVEHGRALEQRDAFSEACRRLLDRYTCLLSPTTLVTAPHIGREKVGVDGVQVEVRQALISCTCPFSMVGLPAISLPIKRVEGLPVGLQLVGPIGGDEALLQVADSVQGIGAGNCRIK